VKDKPQDNSYQAWMGNVI